MAGIQATSSLAYHSYLSNEIPSAIMQSSETAPTSYTQKNILSRCKQENGHIPPNVIRKSQVGWETKLVLQFNEHLSSILFIKYVYQVYYPYSQSSGFSSSHVQMWELDHEEGLNAEEWKLSNCGAGEDSWESLGQQGDEISQS